jgi:hypothetical protein
MMSTEKWLRRVTAVIANGPELQRLIAADAIDTLVACQRSILIVLMGSV